MTTHTKTFRRQNGERFIVTVEIDHDALITALAASMAMNGKRVKTVASGAIVARIVS